MSDKLRQTVRIVRRARVETDRRGQTVWTDPVETVELELVTTGMLKNMLASGDKACEEKIREAAAGKDGLLARDPEKDAFEIIDDAELQAVLDATAASGTETRPADVTYEVLTSAAGDEDEELSLVSTQALRRMLGNDTPASDDAPTADEPTEDGGGFNPYDNA